MNTEEISFVCECGEAKDLPKENGNIVECKCGEQYIIRETNFFDEDLGELVPQYWIDKLNN